MTMWLLSHQLDTWSKLSCMLLLICRISFPEVCSVVSSASMSQSTHIFFMCNGRSLIKRLKRIGPKIIYTLIWFVTVLFCSVVPVHAHAMLPSCYYALWAFGSSMSFWKYSFLAFLIRFFTLFLNFLYSGKHFSLFSLSLSAIVSLMSLAMVVTLDVLPTCALKVQVYWQQWDRHWERENSNSNSKTLFYKDCSLGSFKNLSNN